MKSIIDRPKVFITQIKRNKKYRSSIHYWLTQCHNHVPSNSRALQPILASIKDNQRSAAIIWQVSNRYWILDRYKSETYSIVINIIIILRDLGRIEKVEETFTFFCFCDGFSIFWSFPWLLLKNLLCQALSWMPLNLRPRIFKY